MNLVGPAGIDHARADHRHLDPATHAHLLPEAFGNTAYEELRGSVNPCRLADMNAGDRAHIQDAAGPALQHRRQHRGDRMQIATQIGIILFQSPTAASFQ